MRDSGCNGMIVKRKLVDKEDFTGEVGHMMTVNRTLIRASFARINVDTTFYIETVKVMCMKDNIFDLNIGKVLGARKSNDPNLNGGDGNCDYQILPKQKRANVEILSH